MRTEKEMMELILKVAEKNERIRAVYLNGSRTNPNITKDIFQDYDIVYVVDETLAFIKDKNWIDIFGQRLYMQLPDELDKELGLNVNLEQCYGYLIQFADGNRLDLRLMNLDYAREQILNDKLAIILSDKDNLLPSIPISTDIDYWVKRPTEIQFGACCNEFWWCLNNVSKGMWREEILYVMDTLDSTIRVELKKMLTWNVGMQTDFSVSVGKSGKFLNKYLQKDLWKRFCPLYIYIYTLKGITLCGAFLLQILG
nr:aminoglycoside 6-adenylyltransferase [Clostridioides sp.]